MGAWAAPARLIRVEIDRVSRQQFVIAERALGTPMSLVVLRSIIPLAIGPAMINLLALLPELLTVDLALSFFGIGAQPPTPTLGRMIYDGFQEISFAPWTCLVPAGCLLVLLMLLSLAGRFWPLTRFLTLGIEYG
jgi:ABC-type dipeptide/oligopeptide/nickel transport system permease subunit